MQTLLSQCDRMTSTASTSWRRVVSGTRYRELTRQTAIPHLLVAWRVKILNETVAAEIAALPADMQARFLRLAERIDLT